MPKRTDIKKILVIGAGPIVIGQACEFDYSGTQGVKALKSLGYEVVLINSNPATIMTDPELADRTYIEPIAPEVVARIVEIERPDAILPTLGGQTALNTALQLHEMGVLDKYKVELIGANVESIKKAEDRQLFRDAMDKIGLKCPKSVIVHSVEQAMKEIGDIGFPAILRPAFTLGGTGGNISYTMEEFREHIKIALDASPKSQVLIDQSVIGWKEYELEVVRDKKDNVIIICSIENFDAMGVHTGDSITVAPAQTLTDKEYQQLRNAAIAIMREIGVDTGGSNVQFAVNPKTGELLIVEMNPRVSRSSALASKATGFPIAKIAAKLSVGFTLDELKNDITRDTPASFEPSIDYVVVKVPRFTFEKFPQADDRLGTQMKSVGEAMSIGRTFKESLQKAIRSMEIGKYGFEEIGVGARHAVPAGSKQELKQHLSIPRSDRLWWIAQAIREKMSVAEIYKWSGVDPWFLEQIKEIVDFEKRIVGARHVVPAGLRKGKKSAPAKLDRDTMLAAKRMGFADRRLAQLTNNTEDNIRKQREKFKIRPVFKKVDTCAAEFVAHTPYLYSTYESENEANPTKKKKVVILGGGPNRIGQGIEFDYCCCHASFSLREDDYEVIMVNCNPETVSTDYDTSDRLYFEPLTKEDVIRILEEEKPLGIIVQFGGQTPLKLSVPLEKWGAKILGTSSDSIDRVEDRERFADFIRKLKLKQPDNGIAKTEDQAIQIARGLGYPIIVRPSYVLGGRAMQIVYDEAGLCHYMKTAVQVSEDKPVLVDRFLESAVEVDVDALGDGKEFIVAGVMEHIERAGIHSGDSACVLPPHTLSREVVNEIVRQTKIMAKELKVIGLMNVQFAVQDNVVYILEVNPRASRTVPFVSKATGRPIAKIAAKLMLGKKLAELGVTEDLYPAHTSVKEAVFPFNKFPGVDTLLGPEMKSTGEVMGIDDTFAGAFAKSQLAAGNGLPKSGKVFISVTDADKDSAIKIAQKLAGAGYDIVATSGTALALQNLKVKVEVVRKHYEGEPNILAPLKAGSIAAVINTHEGKLSAEDSYIIRRTALVSNTPYFTTIAAANAAAEGMVALTTGELSVKALQDYFGAKTNVKQAS